MITKPKLNSPAVYLSETTILWMTALLIGLGTGLGAVGFIKLIEIVETFFFHNLPDWIGNHRWLLILIPALGGLISGPIISFFAREAKGHGVPEVMQAIALRGGRIRPRVVVAKIAASAVCIGSGGSAGREGPIVQVGAALGSTLGQWLHLSDRRIRNLVACGSAAGIAATFNAPIAGVIFALEIILGELHMGDLGNVVISAITASTIARIFLGETPAFIVPDYGLSNPWTIFLYALLGVVAAVTAVGFIRMLYWTEDTFDEWKIPDFIKPAIGGLLLGLMGYLYPMLLGDVLHPTEARLGQFIATNVPHVMGSGFDTIEHALVGKAPLILLLVLIFLKPVATALTLGSGNSGGVFAPALFTGAALGGAFGYATQAIFPHLNISPGAFAVVGMAAVFAGAARAPFTAILIVFEMTDDYHIILPLMTGVIVSLILAEHIFPESIYTLKLARRGIRFRHGRDIDVMEAVKVQEIMVTNPMTVSPKTNVETLVSKFIATGMHGFPVIDEHNELVGIVSLRDYRQALDKYGTLSGKQVGDIMNRQMVVAYPDESVGQALRHMAPRDISRLPVVARDNPRKLLGLIRRNDIVRAYELGATRRDERMIQSNKIKIAHISGLDTTEIPVLTGSACDGKRMRDIRWPENCLVVAIERPSGAIIPHGDEILHAGDVLVTISDEASLAEVKVLCSEPAPDEKVPPKNQDLS